MPASSFISVFIYGAILLASSALILRIRVGRTASRPPRQQPPSTVSGSLASVGVVVAARDEESSLASCLAALASQEGELGSLRFVIVDDHSSDATGSIVSAFAADHARFISAHTPAGEAGKAAALAHGIGLLDTEIIVTTDADCIPPPSWLRSIVGLLPELAVDLICGPTVVRADSFSERVQRLDWLLLLGLAGAFSASGMPITAMGNNMAMRRAAYDAVGGYKRFLDTPTEDYGLFRAVNRMSSGSARLMLLPEVVNYTEAEESLRSAFRQRKRWALGGLKASWWVWLLYAVVWLAHAGTLTAALVSPQSAAVLLASLLGSDAVLLYATGRALEVDVPWPAFPGFELFKCAYVILMPFALLVRPSVGWKGRRY